MYYTIVMPPNQTRSSHSASESSPEVFWWLAKHSRPVPGPHNAHIPLGFVVLSEHTTQKVEQFLWH